MDFFHRTVIMAKWFGIAPVKKSLKNRKGLEYELSRKAIVFFLLQLAMLVWMVVQFRNYINRKLYYQPLRKLQVKVLMYCEVGQALCTVVLSFKYRFPNITNFLGKCTGVMRDLGGTQAPWVARYCGSLVILMHTLLTFYRGKNSNNRTILMIPFWTGMTQVIILHMLLFVSLMLVDMSYKTVIRDLSLLSIRRPRENSHFVNEQLCLVRQRHLRALQLLTAIKSNFAPDVFFICFFFMFKTTFICYHIYYKQEVSLAGENTLVGEVTGYFQIIQLFVCTFCLAYVCDAISDKKIEVHVLLLSLLKDRNEGAESEVRDIVQSFILQLKSQPGGFCVCNQFILNRELLYSMALAAVTYVFILIQFQGTKVL